ncbi:GspH/FimT family protein [Saccharospirillum mangrovi]|uniref:GspH/FimT family protein n=1 Tax=Saccharospirillum mangrovi TaxID=2161747 RepID=UPI000D3948D8|nr:GspH/FimT family protein [Saccharospirillum mangrovi]
MNGWHSAHGWTLIELLVSLALLALLTAVALPGYQSLIQTQSANRLRDDLFAHLTLARTQARTLGLPVAVCTTTDLFVANPNNLQCASAGGDWTPGWFVFVDLNEDKQHQDGEPLISVYEDAPLNVSVRFNLNRAVLFDRQGRASGSNGSFFVCRLDIEFLSAVVISPTGRIRFDAAKPENCVG